MQFATTSNRGIGNSPGGRPDQHAGPAFARHAHPCLNALSDGAVISTPWAPPSVPFLTAATAIPVLGVDHHIGAQALGMRELAVVDIDRADLQAHRLGILDRQMPEAADAGDDDPLARPRLRLLDALIGRDPGADQRRGLVGPRGRSEYGPRSSGRRRCIRQSRHSWCSRRTAPRRRPSPSAVRQYSQWPQAEYSHGTPTRSPSFTAVTPAPRATTRPMPSWPGMNGKCRLERPVSVRGVQIGVADAASLGLDQDLARSGRWDVQLPEFQRLAELRRRRRLALSWLMGRSLFIAMGSACTRQLRASRGLARPRSSSPARPRHRHRPCCSCLRRTAH